MPSSQTTIATFNVPAYQTNDAGIFVQHFGNLTFQTKYGHVTVIPDKLRLKNKTLLGLELHDVEIKKGFRHKGYGTHMLNEVMKKAKQEIIMPIAFFSVRGFEEKIELFYKKAGFESFLDREEKILVKFV